MGLRDSNLSERLQTYPELNLYKAVTMARRTEAVREHQAVVRGETDNTSTVTPTKKLETAPSQQDSTRKVAPDVASFQLIQLRGL